MKKLLAIILLALVFFGNTAAGIGRLDPPVNDRYWENLNEELKFAMETSTGFEVFGYFYTEEALSQFYGTSWQNREVNFFAKSHSLKTRWPDRIPLRLIIKSRGGYFLPWAFSFVQNGEEHEVEASSDIFGFGDNLGDERLPKGRVIRGFLAIPKSIDLNETFKIYYGSVEVDIGPCDLEA